jgi:hypothetical protein
LPSTPQHAPARAHAEIAELGRLVGGVPALHDALEGGGQLFRQVTPEPGRLDETAAQRGGRLLVLAGEIVFADRAADMLEHRARLALRMQRLAAPSREMLRSQHRVDQLGLVVLGDCREAHDVPRLLRQHVAGEIVLVQPVHDQDDGARELVVEPAVERVVVPFVRRLPLGLRQCLLGL